MTSPPSRDRVLGLSRKARRLVFPAIVLAIIIILVGSVATRGEGGAEGPMVGPDLHAVAELHGRLFVGGHAGAGLREDGGAWTQISSLADRDVMSWAESADSLLAGGHGGLYLSDDDGSTFVAARGISVTDVHSVGASGQRVYVGSPESGVLVSEDGGRTFAPASSAGRDFMGTIWVDPANPDVAIAPAMQSGAMRTIDGGATWAPLGSSPATMAVAVDRTGRRVTAISMGGAEQSDDGGSTWAPLDVPAGTSAAVYTADGDLVVAALSGARAKIYASVDGRWDLRT